MTEKAGQSDSAVIRAALRFALPLFATQPQLVAQLDAGAKVGPLTEGILDRAVLLSQTHGVGADVVLSAAMRAGFLALEQNTQMNGQLLEAFASGILEHPMFQKIIGQMVSSPQGLNHMIDDAAVKAGLPVSVEVESEGLNWETIRLPPQIAAVLRDEARRRKKSVGMVVWEVLEQTGKAPSSTVTHFQPQDKSPKEAKPATLAPKPARRKSGK